MSEPISNTEIEDVLSSIRKLVSENTMPRDYGSAAGSTEKLILTPAFRVTDEGIESSRPEYDHWSDEGEDDSDLPENEAVADDLHDTEAAAPMADADPVPQAAEADEAPEARFTHVEHPEDADLVASDAAAAGHSLEDRIAELEAAVGRAGGEWEPDGSEDQDSHKPRVVPFQSRHRGRFADVPLTPAPAEERAAEPAPDAAEDDAPRADIGIAAAMPFIGRDFETAPVDAPEEASEELAEAGDAVAADDLTDTVDEVEAAALPEEAEAEADLAAPEEESLEADPVEAADDAALAEDEAASDELNDELGDELAAALAAVDAPETADDDEDETAEAATFSHYDADHDDEDDTPELADILPVIDTKEDLTRSAQAQQVEEEPIFSTRTRHVDEWEDVSPDLRGIAQAGQSAGELAYGNAMDAAAKSAEDQAAASLGGTQTAQMDEAALREMVGQMVRDELQGVLGERITRNVRRLVRREVARALALKDFD